MGSRYTSIMSAETEVASCVRGYHVYKDRWAAAVGELLTCSREPTNASNRYAVTVSKDGTTIGHLLRKMCKVCSVYLRRSGLIINAPVLNIRTKKIFVVEYYSSNKFSVNECSPKIFPLRKKDNYGTV